MLTLSRASHRYKRVADEQAALKMRIRDLAQARVSYGYRRLHVLLQREGWEVNHKRVYRLYCQEGLMLRNKKPKRLSRAGSARSGRWLRGWMRAGPWIS